MIRRALLIFLSLTLASFGVQSADAAAKAIANLAISRAAVASTSGVAFTTQPVVKTVDASNDDVKTSGNVITAAITGGVGGTLIGTTSATTSNQGKATFTNLGITGTPGATYTVTYSFRTFSISENVTLALNAALVPTFRTYTSTFDGFTVAITNYDEAYNWSGTATNGGVVAIDDNGLVIVTGLGPGTNAVATVTTTRSGYNSGSSNTASTSSLNAPLTPIFDQYTATNSGFTVMITNYSNRFNWSGTATNGGQVSIANNGLVTVTGLAPGAASVATITSMRSGYLDGVALTASTSSLISALTPTFSAITSGFGQFSFSITNYDANFIFTPSTTDGVVNLGTPEGANLLVTVSELTTEENVTVTVTTTRAGFPDGTGTKIGNARISALSPTTGDPAPWTTSAISDNGRYVIFAGIKSKLFVSTDNGDNWTVASTPRTWTAVAVSGNGSKMLAAGTNSKIYYSSNNGTTWSAKSSARNWRALAANSDGSKLFAAVQNGFIYRSTNNGDSWTKIGVSKNWRALATSQNGNIVLAAAFGGNLYVSTNGGNTWNARESVRNWSAVSISDDGTVMIATVGNGFAYISYDSGETWNQINGFQRKNWNSISCDATCANFAITSVSGDAMVITLGGLVIFGVTNLNYPKKWSTITLNSAGTQVIVGATSGMIWRGSDNFVNWSHRTRVQE